MLLAGWNSYWFDEILSVARYGTDNDTIVSALKTLAQHSSHPPLYHIILFFWMKLFGDAEIATRTLSNLYVTGATLCLYILALKLFGRRVAIDRRSSSPSLMRRSASAPRCVPIPNPCFS